ncbi:MAG: RhuM family protein [Clostridium sp.]|nr:RhuM family protein [Clostridium sp.]MDY5484459.1 RhuM family protein [Clostridium sp.]
MMATLYDVGLPTINEHIKKIYADSELEETATIRNFRIVQTEGLRQVTRNTKHYNLQMIIAVGFKVNNERADADKPHMGLTTWAAAPEGKIVKSDVSVAKNYLSEKEMRSLERIVSAYLDLAEDRAERHIPMTMEDWAKRLDLFLMADDREVLQDAGKITAEIARAKAETEFEKYRVVQDRLFMSDFDKYMLELEENAKK